MIIRPSETVVEEPVSGRLLLNLRESGLDVSAPESGDLETVYYLGNMGNAGDSLILEGTRIRLAAKNVVPLTPGSPPGGTVYIAGNGAMVPYWDKGAVCGLIENYLEMGAFAGREVEILPSTISGERTQELLVRLAAQAESLVVGCREAESSKRVCGWGLENTVVSSDEDMALMLPVVKGPHTLGRLLARRGDEESTGAWGTLLDNFDSEGDVSRRGGGWLGWETDSAAIAEDFLHVIGSHREVETDRLHVAIGAVLTGAERVVLHGNSYHKNRAVWERSLKQRGVEWGGPEPESEKE